MFQVFLHNSTTTPPQPGYGQLLRAALSDVQAEAFDAGGGYRLADGAELYLLAEIEDGISLVEYPRLTPSVAEAIFEITKRTGSLIFVPGSYAFRIAGNPGEPPAMFAIAIDAVGLGEIANAVDLEDMLAGLQADHEASHAAGRTSAASAGSRTSFGQRMVDLVFGRAG